MKKRFCVCTVFSLYLLLLMVPAACEVRRVGIQTVEPVPPPLPVTMAGPPPHAPAHGYRAKQYTYFYYPSEHVYFDQAREVYFYMEGDAWKVSVSLPESITVQLGDHVTIFMDSDIPYAEFKEHRRKYPHGRLKKKKKW